MSAQETFTLVVLIAACILGLASLVVAFATMTRRAPRGPDTETSWPAILGKLYGSFLLVTMLVILIVFTSYALYV